MSCFGCISIMFLSSNWPEYKHTHDIERLNSTNISDIAVEVFNRHAIGLGIGLAMGMSSQESTPMDAISWGLLQRPNSSPTYPNQCHFTSVTHLTKLLARKS
ncbi:hypothetical protein K443DRAFT_14780 [Laccaria amethystina LaAM-08-1]|uniref:Uncharacterized protein n=1 Tax=Laccaria amethystina LaAM-08-1 TaxID=1095629 RepID=A0A0C9X381_9AGAR|nr:hypothetical protein K443DRAFT_14780 [Laccaria amethystina LaAM-08-1]